MLKLLKEESIMKTLQGSKNYGLTSIIALCGLFLVSCSNSEILQKDIDKTSEKSCQVSEDFVEQKEEVTLDASGKVPSWIKGTFVRNGPGKFNVGEHTLNHWFDGFALLAGFSFDQGIIGYRSAFIESDQYKESMSSGELRLDGFDSNYAESGPKHLSKDGQNVKTANPNINLEQIGGEFVALGETPLPVAFDLKTLSTLGIFDYNDSLKKRNIWECAHMKRDSQDQVLYNFYIDYGRSSYYVLYKIEPGSSERKVIGKHEIATPSYMHDFSITENYIVLTAYPLVVNPIDLANSKNGFIRAHKWKPELKTTVYVFDKKTGELVCEPKTDAMFAFHHFNAYEEKNGEIHIILAASKDSKKVLNVANTNKHKSYSESQSSDSRLIRLKIDTKKSKISQKILSKDAYEMPKIRDDQVARKNTYFYALRFNAEHGKKGFGLVKYNLDTNRPIIWFKNNMFPGEPIFVPKPGSTLEDDGAILSIVHDANQSKSFLLILDAKNMKELARVSIPQSIPLGLHGKFF